MDSMTDNFAPYAPPENVLRVIERIRKAGLPPKLNAEYLSQLGLNEAIIPRVLRSLDFLGLSDGGKTTDLAQSVAITGETEWPSVFQGMLRLAYDFVFRVIDPETASRKAVDDAFRPRIPSGQRNRMVTLFLGLCQAAGFAVMEPVYQRPGHGQPKRDKVGTAKLIKRKQGVPQNTHNIVTIERPALPPSGRLHPALAGIVSTIPDIESRDDLERWIASFRATVEMVKKLDRTD